MKYLSLLILVGSFPLSCHGSERKPFGWKDLYKSQELRETLKYTAMTPALTLTGLNVLVEWLMEDRALYGIRRSLKPATLLASLATIITIGYSPEMKAIQVERQFKKLSEDSQLHVKADEVTDFAQTQAQLKQGQKRVKKLAADIYKVIWPTNWVSFVRRSRKFQNRCHQLSNEIDEFSLTLKTLQHGVANASRSHTNNKA